MTSAERHLWKDCLGSWRPCDRQGLSPTVNLGDYHNRKRISLTVILWKYRRKAQSLEQAYTSTYMICKEQCIGKCSKFWFVLLEPLIKHRQTNSTTYWLEIWMSLRRPGKPWHRRNTPFGKTWDKETKENRTINTKWHLNRVVSPTDANIQSQINVIRLNIRSLTDPRYLLA